MNDAEKRYALLKQLAATVPDLGKRGTPPRSPETFVWLGNLHAAVDHLAFGIDAMQVKVAGDHLGNAVHEQNVSTIMAAMYRAIAKLELMLPAAAQGAFLAAGSPFDALAATSKILDEARSEILFVDPYLGSKVLTSFAIQAREQVAISLLAAKERVKGSLKPAGDTWVTQYGVSRPLSVRLAPARALHDRLIIVDRAMVWDVSQSFEDLAARSPATLAKAAPDQAKLKIEAYRDIYDAADALIP